MSRRISVVVRGGAINICAMVKMHIYIYCYANENFSLAIYGLAIVVLRGKQRAQPRFT